MGSRGVSPARAGHSVSKTRVGRYELGKTLGEGNFGKVKFARNVDTEEHVAIKILDKEKLLKHNMINQIKREIATMKLIRHPNVVHLHEVMASKTKIYIVLEFVTGGELFDKIACNAKLKEDEARKYFQQLINAVDYCHSRGVFHRDLKPENLLLDANGILKISDFGLSALAKQVGEDGLLHTTCGTPNYVAPEVIKSKGYNGAAADLWSCGIVLFVLMAGYLPFEDSNITALYKKIHKANFTFPAWFSTSAKKLITRILDPNPSTRITISEVIENEWFRKGYRPPVFEEPNISLDDIDVAFDQAMSYEQHGVERQEKRPPLPKSPLSMNAFDLISTSQGLNLGILFENETGVVKRETRFTSKCSADEIISKIEQMAGPLGFDVKKNNFKMKLQGEKLGRKGQLAVATEMNFSFSWVYRAYPLSLGRGYPHLDPPDSAVAVPHWVNDDEALCWIFEVAPSLYVVELRKSKGDTLEFHTFYKKLSTALKDVIWRTGNEIKEEEEVIGS